MDWVIDRSSEVMVLRRHMFAALRHGDPPSLEDLARRTGYRRESVRHTLTTLVAAGVAVVEESGTAGDLRVLGADGLTVMPTAHQLLLHGAALHTWCAFDAVGIPAGLGGDAVARTDCPWCSARIELTIRKGQPPAEAVVGWWPVGRTGPVRESFCREALLFCDTGHLTDWRRVNGVGPGEAASLEVLAGRGHDIWSMFAADLP